MLIDKIMPLWQVTRGFLKKIPLAIDKQYLKKGVFDFKASGSFADNADSKRFNYSEIF